MLDPSEKALIDQVSRKLRSGWFDAAPPPTESEPAETEQTDDNDEVIADEVTRFLRGHFVSASIIKNAREALRRYEAEQQSRKRANQFSTVARSQTKADPTKKKTPLSINAAEIYKIRQKTMQGRLAGNALGGR